MDKGSKRRQEQIRATAKASGGFGKPVYKKKAKPFPTPSKEDMSLATQRSIFYGVR